MMLPYTQNKQNVKFTFICPIQFSSLTIHHPFWKKQLLSFTSTSGRHLTKMFFPSHHLGPTDPFSFFGTWWLSHFPTAPPTPSWVLWWVPPRRPDLPWPGVRQSGCAWHRCYTARYTPRRRKGGGPEPATSCWKLSRWHSNLGFVGWFFSGEMVEKKGNMWGGSTTTTGHGQGGTKNTLNFIFVYICTVFSCWMILIRPTSRKSHENKKWPHIKRLFRNKLLIKHQCKKPLIRMLLQFPPVICKGFPNGPVGAGISISTWRSHSLKGTPVAKSSVFSE